MKSPTQLNQPTQLDQPAQLDQKVAVLIVDDSDDQRALLRRYFEREGCVVTTAQNAQEAMLAYRTRTPDLAVIDLVLPGMTGWELTDCLRAEHPECVIAITSVLSISKYPASQANLPKPFTGAQVRKLLGDHVVKWTSTTDLDVSTPEAVKPKRVVIADDDADIRVLIAIAVRKAGFDLVAEESDGRAALDAVRLVQPDLAILDVSMPTMTGIEVCRAVREDASLDDVRLVLLSAGADDRAREVGLASGADHYLIKPFSPRALAVTLAEMMVRVE